MRAADEHIGTTAAGDDEIVRNEPVSPLHEIEHAFGLSNSALANEQQADAEDVGQRSVQVGRWRELFLEPRLDARVELIGLELRPNERDAGGPRELDEIRRRRLA